MPIDLARERERHAEALARALDAVLAHLRADPQVQRVIVFGSYAEGRRDLFTDLDLLVVMDSSLDFVTRNAELCRGLDVQVAVDILAYTPEELDSIGHRPFVKNALESGRTLYERRS